MNKKLVLAGAAAGIGLAVEVAVHGYMDVMAREKSVKSFVAAMAEKMNNDSEDSFAEFNKSKHEWINNQKTEKISITSERGDLLKGWLTLNENKSSIFVFCAHGYHSDHMGDPANFMQYYIEKGYNFLTVDHVAHGQSSGNYIGFDYFESADSLEWLDYLIRRFGSDIKIILHGVSMGAATICKIADKVPSQVILAVADCPYTSAVDEFTSVVNGVGIKNAKPLVSIFNAMNKVFAGFDLNDTDVRKSVKNSKIPMLFVHGKEDTFVPVSMGQELFDLCENEKDRLLVDGAKHAESISVNEKAYHKKLDEFIGKYIK